MAWRIIKPKRNNSRLRNTSQFSNDHNKKEKNEWDMYWSDQYIPEDILNNLKTYQKVNHFPGMYLISNKIQLANSLRNMKKLFKQDYSIFPKSWVFP